jgi:hypothetical protein
MGLLQHFAATNQPLSSESQTMSIYYSLGRYNMDTVRATAMHCDCAEEYPTDCP